MSKRAIIDLESGEILRELEPTDVILGKKIKEELAAEIVDRFHGVGAGIAAKEEFERVFAKNS